MCLKLAVSKHKKGVNRYGWDIFMLVAKDTGTTNNMQKMEEKVKTRKLHIFSCLPTIFW